MALTSAQKVTVAEITREAYATIDTSSADLNAAQETFVIDRLAAWALVRDSHVKVRGGKDGVDFDNERKREAIRQSVRKVFGLSLISDEVLALDPDVMSLFELEVGQNFG